MSRRSDATRILMLHRVLDDAPTAFGLPSCYRMRGTALTPAELTGLLDLLDRTVSLADVERALVDGQPPPTGCVLTFDDGYREHVDLVVPMLRARGMTATFYVATGLHGDGGAVAPVDAWYWLLDHAHARHADVPLPGGGRYFGRVDTLEAKAAWVSGVPKQAFLSADAPWQHEMLAELSESLDTSLPPDLCGRLYLRRPEWAVLRAQGMDVGAHSVTHPRLSQLPDLELEQEVTASIDGIRAAGGRVPFAYPDGAFDDRVTAVVTAAGASSAVTCEPGVVGQGASLMRLPREFMRPPSADGAWST